MKQVTIYTDGSCLGNPGPGGWAAVLRYGEYEKETGGAPSPLTTNNRMELLAAVEALRALKTPCEVELHSDSSYMVNAFTKRWVNKWQANGWKTAQKEPVKNPDLWADLMELVERAPGEVLPRAGSRGSSRERALPIAWPGMRLRASRPSEALEGPRRAPGEGILGVPGRKLRRFTVTGGREP